MSFINIFNPVSEFFKGCFDKETQADIQIRTESETSHERAEDIYKAIILDPNTDSETRINALKDLNEELQRATEERRFYEDVRLEKHKRRLDLAKGIAGLLAASGLSYGAYKLYKSDNDNDQIAQEDDNSTYKITDMNQHRHSS